MVSDPTASLPGGAPDPDLEPGQVVGEYVVEHKLGQGGFGAVFRATHPLIGKVVAIKVLARKFSVDPEMVSRFQAEAKAVNQIRHRNIIDIFSFSVLQDGRCYYVMEYLDGEPLDARLDRVGAMPLAEAMPILRAVAKALDAAHQKGIAHRDLKPENIFLARDSDGGDFPKLLDFGIAKLLGGDDTKHRTRTGIPIGTPYYMSPEQCRGKDVDHRTDFYAFGVLAYVMLTGKHPIDADDYMSIMLAQLTEVPVPPSQVNSALPTAIDEVIAWLMRKSPLERPQNLATAMRELEKAARDSGVDIPYAPPTAAIGAASASHIGVTPTPSSLRPPSFGPRPGTNPALAATTPSGMSTTPLPTTKRRTWAYAAAFAASVVAGATVYIMLTQSSSSPSPTSPSPIAAPAPVPAPTPAPTPTPTPSPDPPPPPPSTTITLTISDVPSNTEVLLAGKKLGTAPGPITLDRGDDAVEVVFRHAGYTPLKESIVPDHDQDLHLAMHHAAKSTTSSSGSNSSNSNSNSNSTAPDPHGTENPFKH